MDNAIETKFYRTNDGRPVRARVLPMTHAEDMNPRENDIQGSVMITFGWNYYSPDKIEAVPEPLSSIVRQWSGNTYRSANGIRVDLVKRWCSIFAPEEVLYVGALWRENTGGLRLSEPRQGDEDEGIIMVTRATIRKGWGEEYPMTHKEAEALAKAEVQEYSDWASGEVYGYVIESPSFPGADIDHDAEEIDACWGFMGQTGIQVCLEHIDMAMEGRAKEISEADFDEIMDFADRRHREAVRHLTWN